MKKIGLSLVMVALAASAANAQFQGSNAAAMPIPDNSAGGVMTVINVPNNFAITGIAVTLNGLTHSWVGDLIVTLQAPNGNTATIMRRTGRFTPTAVGDSSDLNGGYRFTDRFGAQNFSVLGGGATDIALAAAGTPGGNWWSEAGVTGAPAPNSAGATTYVLRAGDYIANDSNPPASGGNYGNSYLETNLLATLGSQSNGDWKLMVSDHAGADTGSVAGGWKLQLLPEPTTMSLIGLGVLGLLRRRSR